MLNELMTKLQRNAIPFENRGEFGVLIPHPQSHKLVLFSFVEKGDKVEMVDHRYGGLTMYGTIKDVLEYVLWNYED